MKKLRTIATILIFATMILATIEVRCQSNPPPSQNEISAWIQANIDKTIENEIRHDYISKAGTRFVGSDSYNFHLDGCRVSLQVNDVASEFDLETKDYKAELNVSMDLKDSNVAKFRIDSRRPIHPLFQLGFDPSDAPLDVLVLETLGSRVAFRAAYHPFVAHRSDGDHAFGEERDQTFTGILLEVPISDKGMGERMVKAFHDLALSCGATQVKPNLY